MEIFSARRLTNMGLIAAIYVVATMLCSSLAYGQVQFRISEVGTLATVVAAVLIYLLRNKVNLVVASLFPVISNAVIVGFELTYVFKTPLLVNMGWVALGEFVCVTIVGVILIKALMKNKYFSKLVTFGMSDQALSEQFKNG